eukprot:TRINITY_DN15735_c0_g1_i1.p1 TRINITY_DN15735_c0_g1~~TRINITY_DN15735_c0_g1_i1.p1  ORF type:complete len:279 (-),score=48.81 TRINITY_DN15735_c0_g1_i1:54-890(-)
MNVSSSGLVLPFEELDRNLSSIFVGAANQLTHLFKTSKIQNRQAFSLGYRTAIEHLTEFLLKRDQTATIAVSVLLDHMKDQLRRNESECSKFEAENQQTQQSQQPPHHHAASTSTRPQNISQGSTPTATPPTTPHILSPSFAVQQQSVQTQTQHHQPHPQHTIHSQNQPTQYSSESCTIANNSFPNSFQQASSPSNIFFGQQQAQQQSVNSPSSIFGGHSTIETNPNNGLAVLVRKRDVDQVYCSDTRMTDENYNHNTTMEFTYGDQRIWKKTKSDFT